MALNDNNRLYWAVMAAGLAPDGSSTFTEIKGLQSLGITTNFNLEQVFQIGQLAIYENVEELPDIEVTAEKVIDGNPLIYHLATPGATSASLAGRANEKATLAFSIFGDEQNSASGTPHSQVVCSGMYVSSLNYTFPVDGNCTESVTLVGNNKVWKTSAFTFSGNIFDNTASAPSGVQRRQNIVFGAASGTATQLPSGNGGIPGLSANGYNVETNGKFGAAIQNITVSADLGRETLNELGRKGPYHRYVTFPVEVTTDIEVISKGGDLVDAEEEADNLDDQTIKIFLETGTKFDLGSKNKLSSVSHSGGDAGGDNVTVTFSYQGFNELTITDANDPAGL